MIIGLTGKKQSGKDTTYEVIKGLVPHAERRGFADKLKQSVAALLGVSVEWIETNKLSTDVLIYGDYWTDWHGEHGWSEGFRDSEEISLTIRELLQRYGTEAHRDVFGEDFWLEQCLPKSDLLFYNALNDGREKLIVVTDVRFDNEAKWIKDLGGIVWHIRRPGQDDGDTHPSEIPVNEKLVDLEVWNDGSLNDLKYTVKGALNESGYIVTK